MSTFTKNLLDSTYSDGADGREYVVTGLVDGLEGDPDQRLYDATLHPDVPRRGDPHPAIPNLFVADVSAAFEGEGAKVRVTVTYKPASGSTQPVDDDAPGILQVRSQLRQTTTNFDVDGDPISVSFTGASDGEPQVADVETVVSHLTLIRERRESSAPVEKMKTHVGTVNEAAIWGYPARTLLCDIQAESPDGGESWNVTYSFEYNPDTWDVAVAYTDPATGRPAKGVALDDGISLFRVYRESSFALIGVSF